MDGRAAAKAQREAEWRARLKRFTSSKESVEAFCRQEGVGPWSFYQWRRRLGEMDRRASPAKARKQPAAFIDLGALPAKPASAELPARAEIETGAGALDIRLDLGGGLMLTIARR